MLGCLRIFLSRCDRVDALGERGYFDPIETYAKDIIMTDSDKTSDESIVEDLHQNAQTDEQAVVDQSIDVPPESELELVKAELVSVQEENKAIQDKYLRLNAELENYRKRAEREKINAIKFANEKLLREMIPVLDNMEHALVASRADTSDATVAVKHLIDGVQMVEKQFIDVLGRLGIEQIEAQGKAFDPMFHEAMSEVEDNSKAHHTVLEVYQKGYTLNGRLVRPVRVVVSKSSI